MDRPPLILLLGSYNGQDSLGDECLLKCVVDQYRRAVAGPVRFALHAHSITPLLHELMQDPSFVANQGVQSATWLWSTRLRHLRLPVAVRRSSALLLLPELLLAEAGLGLRNSRQVVEQLAEARLLHIFGGTNFVQQWFHLNAPSYVATSLALKARGRPTYFGPQQYGPMQPAQRAIHAAYMRTLVKDYRVRNPQCVQELALDPTKLTPDEVYSNRSLYPVVRERPASPRHILVNLRGGHMSDSSSFSAEHLRPMAELLRKLQARFSLPFKFFAVSGDSFVDDAAAYRNLSQLLGPAVEIDNHGRVHDEHELIRLAADAFACISMSFHGCILSSFAGVPSVPVTAGPYYDHKYVGFDMYGDGQAVPVIPLADAAEHSLGARVVEYLTRYDAGAAAARRTSAAEALESYYRGIVRAEQLSPS